MNKILFTLLSFLFFNVAYNQTATLVKNINPQDAGSGLSDEKASLGTDFIFAADKKLWKTNGTPAGTVVIKDFNSSNIGSVSRLTSFGSIMMFAVGGTTNQLWKSDGTEAGTTLVKDFGTYTIMFYRAVAGSTLFFGAGDAINGNELWKTDGSIGGTVIVKNIAPGSANSSPSSFKAIGSVLMFLATTSTTGSALWRSDGTDAGTTMVKDLDAASTAIGSAGEMTVANSKVFFYFTDLAAGREPWVSDGTDAGTFLLKDIYPGNTSSFPDVFTEVNNKIYFTAQDATNMQMWTTDGTSVNTVPFFDLVPASKNDRYSYLTNANGTLYFSATTNYIGLSSEPYKSNGTTVGTVMLKDIVPGANGSDARGFQCLNGFVYFIANTAATGYELWKSDGTEPNTAMLLEIFPGTTAGIGGTYSINGIVNNKLLFSGVDPIYNAEPFVSDGTAAGTILLKNIFTRGLASNPINITPVGNRLYFNATLGFSDSEPWYSDGTEPGTQQLKDLEAGLAYSNPFNFVNIDNTNFYFNSYNGSQRHIYQSDGTNAGTVKIVSTVEPNPMAIANNILFFVKRDGTNGTELWKYQGGTSSLVKNINPGSANGFPTFLKTFNNQLYFFATTTANGMELWKSDGSDAGTTMVADVNPGPGGTQITSDLIVHGGALYYFAYNGTSNALIKSDGTSAGTSSIKTFSSNEEFGPFFSFGSDLMFSKKNENGSSLVNLELWKTNGTNPGTIILKELIPYTPDIDLDYLHTISFFTNGSLFYFYAEKQEFFEETSQLNFWRSDGTPGGTTQLKSFTFPDGEERDFDNDTRYIARYDNNNVLFAFADAANGVEIWKSDGTVGGTNLSVNMMPGTEDANPIGLLNFGDGIYFSSRGNNDLNELWKIAVQGSLPLNLLSFNATKENEKVQLRWNTTNEVNCAYFNVERSTTVTTFSKIGTVAAANNSAANSYTNFDYSPVKGLNYYRLKMVDNDGRYTYSPVVKIDFTQSNVVSIIPNPAHDYFVIKGARDLKKIKLFDITGKVVRQFTPVAGNRYAISGLPKGTYILSITNADKVESQKIIVE